MRFDTIRLIFMCSANDCVYGNKPSNLEHLKPNMQKVMVEIAPQPAQSMLATLRVEVFSMIWRFTHNVNVQTLRKNIIKKFFYLRLLLKPRNG